MIYIYTCIFLQIVWIIENNNISSHYHSNYCNEHQRALTIHGFHYRALISIWVGDQHLAQRASSMERSRYLEGGRLND